MNVLLDYVAPGYRDLAGPVPVCAAGAAPAQGITRLRQPAARRPIVAT
ncbi:hypothetical protein [Candidatus Amarolinea dominans]|nr:hypothetical protein [Anaerolineae bacterium]